MKNESISAFVVHSDSQTVLRTVADRTDQYPHPIALEIFLANPDVLRDNRFMEYLATKTDAMPQYMIDILLAASSQTTQRTIIMNEWNRAQTIYMKNMNRALWAMSYLDNYDEVDLAEVADEIIILESEFEAIDELLDSELTSEAQNRFDNIEESYYLPEDLELEVNLFGDWITLRNALISSNRNWADLTQQELDQLYSFVDHYKTWVGRSALHVLNLYQSELFQLPPAFSQQWDPRTVEVSKDPRSYVEVYPNPTSSLINIKVSYIYLPPEGSHLKIFDALGQEVFTGRISNAQQMFAVDVRAWSPGLYVFQTSHPELGNLAGKFHVER
jgi:hypothetical protein